jgi:hypothetical protein
MGKDEKNGIAGKGSIQKRLEMLEQAISLKRPRQITVLVDGHSDDQSAIDVILQDLAVVPDDLVVKIAHHGGNDPALPRLLCVITL